ncbi:MAG: YggT family protein [Pseudomonadales bacterium]|jgi:YggT family protein|nr:YggT family protein [Pseudomonadales bacterium]
MGQPLSQAGIYLVQTLFNLYLMAVVIRFVLQLVRADFYNPVSQFFVKVTDPLLKPLRRVIPGYGGIDLASIVLALLVQTAGIYLIILIAGWTMPNLLQPLLWSIVGFASLLLNIAFFAVIIMIILSWVAPQSRNPVVDLLRQITDPIMRPVQRLIPPIGGLDLSPIFVFIAINLLEILVVRNLAIMFQVPRGLIMGL